MITIPIITRIYEEDGEIKFEVAGEKDVPLEMFRFRAASKLITFICKHPFFWKYINKENASEKGAYLQMNVISLDAARKRKQHKKLMITIPIITRIYEEDILSSGNI
jgi:hypothetical protein